MIVGEFVGQKVCVGRGVGGEDTIGIAVGAGVGDTDGTGVGADEGTGVGGYLRIEKDVNATARDSRRRARKPTQRT